MKEYFYVYSTGGIVDTWAYKNHTTIKYCFQ